MALSCVMSESGRAPVVRILSVRHRAALSRKNLWQFFHGNKFWLLFHERDFINEVGPSSSFSSILYRERVTSVALSCVIWGYCEVGEEIRRGNCEMRLEAVRDVVLPDVSNMCAIQCMPSL